MIELSNAEKYLLEILNKENINTQSIRFLFKNKETIKSTEKLLENKLIVARTKRMITNVLKQDNDIEEFKINQKNATKQKLINRYKKNIIKNPKKILDMNQYQFYKTKIGRDNFVELVIELINKGVYSLSEIFKLQEEDKIYTKELNKVKIDKDLMIRELKSIIQDMRMLYFSSKKLEYLQSINSELFYESLNYIFDKELSKNSIKSDLFKKVNHSEIYYNENMFLFEKLLNNTRLDISKLEDNILKMYKTCLENTNIFFHYFNFQNKIINKLLENDFEMKILYVDLLKEPLNGLENNEKILYLKDKNIVAFPLNKEEQEIYGKNQYILDLIEVFSDYLSVNSESKLDHNYQLTERLFNEIFYQLPSETQYKFHLENIKAPKQMFYDYSEMLLYMFEEDLTLNAMFDNKDKINDIKYEV